MNNLPGNLWVKFALLSGMGGWILHTFYILKSKATGWKVTLYFNHYGEAVVEQVAFPVFAVLCVAGFIQYMREYKELQRLRDEVDGK